MKTEMRIKEEFGYDYIDWFEQYDTTWVKLDGKEFNIGKTLYPERYDVVGDFANRDTTWVRLGGDHITIDKSGKPVNLC